MTSTLQLDINRSCTILSKRHGSLVYKKIFDFDYIKGDIPNTFYWYTNTRIIISLDSSAILLILNPYEHDENNTLLQNLKSLLKQVYTETFRILIMNIVELQNLQIWKFFCVGNFNANFRIKRWWAIKIKIYTITACLCLKEGTCTCIINVFYNQ